MPCGVFRCISVFTLTLLAMALPNMHDYNMHHYKPRLGGLCRNELLILLIKMDVVA